ncbi:NADH dehydrogenase subunit C [Geoalkalibacter ferrihydriticus]|uniref:NADH-quinone oxidoreductase subunit C n=2 Tax=Geoalkalibacter ferrihydriticus TaxID=392333 RepID=A0A0C2HS22_9BACT|nr:NADH-quinone oxidoreductase subunit C [Geoalkalibacter ferrihydriticus]KIH77615.1 NADH-quinone oxidoreductase subunit C [Geoalkalibacter ferrihydriticus DSM 17813]SDL70298.1 NADH dehydrogenase subunit C [Geoalkalibacter ferrihydriticus]
MTDQAAVEKLKGKFSSSVLEVKEYRGEVTLTVRAEDILAICAFCKNDLGFNMLADLCGVDLLAMGGAGPRFQVVYNIYNMKAKQRLRLKAPVAEADPRIDSVCSVWGAANWPERECWDLMGISFNNHPDLRRILMTDDWVGHPLRKDYPLQGPDRESYQGREV